MEHWLEAQGRANPDGLALTFAGRAWSYARLAAEVQDLCRRLGGLGLTPGEALAVHLPNSAGFVCLVHAAARLGLVLAPLNLRLALPELSWQLQKLGARWLISDTLTADGLAEAGCTCRVLSLAALQALPAADFKPVPLELDRVQAVVFSSGTTGRPKGALVTYGAHMWSALGSAARLGVLPQDCWLSVLPLYHVGGLAVLFRSCLYGTAVCLHAGFSLEAVARSLSEEPVTLISLVPTLLRRLLEAQVSWPATLRLVLLGGAAAPPDLLLACEQAGLPVATTYGLTETASQVATQPPAATRRKPGSVGKPLLYTQVTIRDESGNELFAGTTGEICVRGPVVMPGYWQDDAATRRSLRDGWLHTGDLGYLDEEGDLWVVQRRSDLILSGGENVYPAEVEAALRLHPAVSDACVVGLPDAEWGQRVAAAVVLRAGQSLTEGELAGFLRHHLAGYKLPRLLRFVEALPLTASGKVRRPAVAALLSHGEESPGEADAAGGA